MPASLAGSIIADKYMIGDLIGTGGMSEVYRAKHASLESNLAVKVLRAEALADETMRKRFMREARATCRLDHPNIIRVTDFGYTDDRRAFMVMEYIEGVTLFEMLHTGERLSIAHVLHIAKQISDALDEAHAHGIIHRDLKPENIIIEKRRNNPIFVKVVDFGIAKILEQTNDGAPQTHLTQLGFVCGTPDYMAPEQAQGKPLDGRADLYALGIILYEMLAQRVPFDGETPVVKLTKHILEKPADIRELAPHISDDLARLIMRLIAKRPEDRPENACEVSKHIARLASRIDEERILVAARTENAIVAAAAAESQPSVIPVVEAPAHKLSSKQPTVETHDIVEAQKTVATPTPTVIKQPAPTHDDVAVIRPSRMPWVIGAIVLTGAVTIPVTFAWRDEAKPRVDQTSPPETSDAHVPEPKPQPSESHAAHAKPHTPPELPPPQERIVREEDGAHRRPKTTIEADAPHTPSPAQPHLSFDALMQRAHRAKAQANWRQAIALYTQAARIKRTPTIEKEIARAYLNLGNTRAACTHFKRFVKAHAADQQAQATHRIAHYLAQCN